MLKKLISLSLVAVMISTAAFAASSDIAVFTVAYAAEATETSAFSYAGNTVEYVTEITEAGSAKHEPIESLPTWDGTVAEAIVGGSGTVEDPYLISDGAELAKFAVLVNSKNESTGTYDNLALCAKLDRDINLANADSDVKNNWADFAIGGIGTTAFNNATNGYQGTFDGQGHNIYNLYYSKYYTANSDINKHGLFRSVATGGNLKNFNVINADFYMGGYAKNGTNAGSIVCGAIFGTNGFEGNTCIENVYVSGSAKSSDSSRYLGIYGSVAGAVKDATVKNCFSSVSVDLSGMKKSDGVISTTYTATAGSATSSGANAGKKELRSYARKAQEGDVSGTSFGVGGVIGVVIHGKNSAAVDNLGNSGNIYAPKNTRVGGVIGGLVSYAGQVSCGDLYNYGDVTGDGLVAGVVGHAFTHNNAAKGNANWYNTGDVHATYEDTTASGTLSPATYAAGVCNFASNRGTGYFYSTGDVTVGSDNHFNSSCGLITTGNTNESANQIYNSALTTTTDAGTVQKWTAANTSRTTEANDTNWWYVFNITSNPVTGTGKTLAEIKAMTADEVATSLGSAYSVNPGINSEGTPVLKAQLSNLVLDEETYEIASGKSLTIAVDEAGYAALDVKAIIEGTTLTVTPKGGEAYTVTAKKGIITLPTKGATEITVSASEGNSFLVKTEANLSLATLEATAIKATVESESATIVLALFDGDTLAKAVYAANVEAADGKISAVIDLTGVNVEGCELRAFVWANGTLVPGDVEIEPLS